LRSIEAYAAAVTLLACLAAPGAARAGDAACVSSSARQEEVFCADTHFLVVLHLAHMQIIARSETVYVDGVRALRGMQYEIDYSRGFLSLKHGLEPGSCLSISYRVLPSLFKCGYSLRSVDESRSDGSLAGSANVMPDEEVALRREPAYNLRASGSKTVSMEAGSLGGVKIDQSLSLSIGGNIGRSVSVVGVLSDKDFGFGQTSQTTRLKDLDKVFIEVTSPGAEARVGDIDLAESPGELLRFERSMTGFYASASRGRGGVRASAASSRTASESVLIEGREGISGPYVVTGPDGRPVSMVPNKERVWVDGLPMQRGKGFDYTVDYAAGAIYFNPSRFIRENSRIAVDYEVQDYEAGRQFYFAGSDLAINENTTVKVTVVNERRTPLASLGSDDIPGGSPSLGTDGPSGWEDGGRYVGPGQGDFVKAEQGSVTFYEYVGDFAGDYEVTFSRVEDGSGDYQYLFSEKWQKYVYLYTGQGSYVAMIGPSPELNSQVVHMAASGSIGSGVEFSTEGALSKSGQRDGGGGWDEAGDGAYSVRLKASTALPRVGGLETGGIKLEVNRRSIGPSYQIFGRIRNPDFMEVWGLTPGNAYEESDGFNVGYTLGNLFKADGGMGRMETDAGRSQRRHASLTIGRQAFGLTAATDLVDMESAGAEGDIVKRGVDLRFPVSIARMNIGNRYEERSPVGGTVSYRRNEIYSEVGFPGDSENLSIKFARTGESRPEGEDWLEYSTVTEGRLEFSANRGSRLEMRGVMGQSRVDYAEHTGRSDIVTTACDLALNVRELYLVSTLSFDYGLASTLTTLYESELVRVGSGGDYDSLGNYVENGDYTLSRREAGKAPVTRMRSRLVLETGKSGKILHKRRLTTRAEIAVDGESTDGRLSRSAFPGYGEIMYGENMMQGRVSASGQIVLNRIGDNTISADFRGARGQDRRCADRVETTAQEQVQVRVISNAVGRMTVSLEGRLSSNRRSIGTGPQAVLRNLAARSVRLDLERPFLRNLRALLGLEIGREKSTVPDYEITQADFSPGLRMFAGDLRFDARMNVRRIINGESVLSAGYMKRNFIDWSTRVSFNHTRYTSLSLEYTGRQFEGSPAIHNMRASVNATF
jgi:hypothetical protein